MGSDFDLNQWCEDFVINTNGIDIISPSYSKLPKTIKVYQRTSAASTFEEKLLKKLERILKFNFEDSKVKNYEVKVQNKMRHHKFDMLLVDSKNQQHIIKDIHTNSVDELT